jgi:DNA repair ATPase RecN
MKLKIKNVILYPMDKELKPRNIEFEEDKVNVITGYSQRGKSAIISIIDFCLGSEDCNIPIGLIRDKVDKFAIYISLKNENLFLARDCPEGNKETSIMYLHQISKKGKKPSFINNSWIDNAEAYKVNRTAVVNYLGGKAGFEKVSEHDLDSLNGFNAPSSFRDTSAFLFQPQSIVANPTTIFFKTETFVHLQRLKVLLPLALGYKSFKIINLENEIAILEKELSDKERKYLDIKTQYENWHSDIYEYYSSAILLGLTNADINIETSNVYQIKDELSKIIKNVKNKNLIVEGSTLRFSEKIEELDNKKNELIRELDRLKFDLIKIVRFDNSKDQYINGTVKEIDNRLKPIDWFLKQKGTNSCPFCGSESDKAINELISLKNIQERNSSIINDSDSSEISFEKEKTQYRNEIRAKENLVKEIETNINILIEKNKENHNRYQRIYEFVGKIDNVLDNLNKIEPSSSLSEEIDGLTASVSKKDRDLSFLKKKFDRDNSLKNVSESISTYIQLLPIEHKEDKIVHLDPEKSASIKIEDKKTNDTTFLWRIGSGANHMCYHISTLLGLHEYFRNLPEKGKTDFIPSFLVFDQPSQVYFPEKFPNRSELSSKESNDLVNTKKIFETCSKFMERTNFQTQIIILEHAPKSTWKDVEHINLVEEWRGEINDENSNYSALIPKDWE